MITKKNKVLFKIDKAKVLAFSFLILAGTVLPAQKRVAPSSVRDTIYHKSGLIYYGQIRAYDEYGKTRLRRFGDWKMEFEQDNIDHIAWSEKSRLKFIEQLVDLDNYPTIDVVYLKDGSILRGEILEYQRGAFLRFKIRSGTVDLAEADIEKMIREPKDPLVQMALQRQKKPKVYAFREKGVYGSLTFALLPGGGDYRAEVGFSWQAAFGYQFRRQFGLGLGVSLDSYASTETGDHFLPVFVEARGYLWRKFNTPFWTIAGGYGFPVRKEFDNQEIRRFDGGYLFHPAVGYRFGANKNLNLTVAMGYKFQKAVTEREFFFSGETITRDVLYRRLSLRMSVIF